MCILTLTLWIGIALAKAPAAAWQPPENLVEDFNRGVTALGEGNPGKAEDIATRLVAKAPDCGMVLVLLGQARSRQNRPADAVDVLLHAVELFPDEWTAHLVLTEAAFAAQDFRVAFDASGRALALKPADPGTVGAALLASLRLGDLEEARARLDRSTLSEPDVACLDVQILLESKDIPAAQARFPACDATASPAVSKNTHAMMAAHTLDEAALYDAAEAHGLTGFALAERAGRLYNAGKYAEALPMFDAARVALPKDVGVRVNRAQCLLHVGRLEEAEAALVEVVASDTWVDLHVSGVMTGITMKSQEVRLQGIQRQAALLLVDVQVRRSRTTEAATSLANARARYGEVIEVVIAESSLVTAQGHPGEGWSLLQAAMTRFPAEPMLVDALVRRAVDDPPGLNAAVVAYVRAHGTLGDRQNLAVAEYNGEDWVGCSEDYAAVASADPARTEAAETAYVCAVLAEDTDRAFALLGPLGDRAPRGYVHDHALVLQKAGRHADVLALLKLYPTADPKLEGMMRRLAVTSHLELGQHAEAAALATKPGLTPRFLAWVGQELLNADRNTDAARILVGTCEQLEGDDAKWCGELVEEAGRP